jgi:hypothetical protein
VQLGWNWESRILTAEIFDFGIGVLAGSESKISSKKDASP